MIAPGGERFKLNRKVGPFGLEGLSVRLEAATFGFDLRLGAGHVRAVSNQGGRSLVEFMQFAGEDVLGDVEFLRLRFNSRLRAGKLLSIAVQSNAVRCQGVPLERG